MAMTRIGSRLYLAAVARHGERLHLVLLRLRADGRLDPGFGRRSVALSRSARPEAILPSRSGVLVALNKGTEPLLSFERGGKVSRRAVGGGHQFAENVRATVVGDDLIVGWNVFSRVLQRTVYHLARDPLAAP